jgi:Cu/Ag efflux protein CusF
LEESPVHKKFIVLTGLLALAGLAQAQTTEDPAKTEEAPQEFPSVAPKTGDLGVYAMAEGRVLMVDLVAGTVTISHTGMSWNNRPAAVDVFQVRQKWLLNDLEPNQQVFFRAENLGARMTITRLVSVL